MFWTATAIFFSTFGIVTALLVRKAKSRASHVGVSPQTTAAGLGLRGEVVVAIVVVPFAALVDYANHGGGGGDPLMFTLQVLAVLLIGLVGAVFLLGGVLGRRKATSEPSDENARMSKQLCLVGAILLALCLGLAVFFWVAS
jgi:hypothetical protein